MSLDLATAYERSGLEQTPENDAIIERMLNIAVAVVENYLDRKFLYGTSVESFYYTHHRNFYLERYPIDDMLLITGGMTHHKVHHRLGKVEFPNYICRDEVEFSYVGGYKVLPADLEEGIWRVFDDMLADATDTGTVTSGEIQSVTVPDVGTIRYSSGSSGGGGSAGTGGNGAIDDTTAALIDSYRRIYC